MIRQSVGNPPVMLRGKPPGAQAVAQVEEWGFPGVTLYQPQDGGHTPTPSPGEFYGGPGQMHR